MHETYLLGNNNKSECEILTLLSKLLLYEEAKITQIVICLSVTIHWEIFCYVFHKYNKYNYKN